MIEGTYVTLALLVRLENRHIRSEMANTIHNRADCAVLHSPAAVDPSTVVCSVINAIVEQAGTRVAIWLVIDVRVVDILQADFSLLMLPDAYCFFVFFSNKAIHENIFSLRFFGDAWRDVNTNSDRCSA